ncbi:hypothetical protein P3339_04030 [Microbulbifer sp. MLAF003]|uniref:hypothetical protein n=1 Tax=Microbulbifer sp. MLAF003 TaxID=3032582 RepID=UPI0024AD7C76|nr:hypothetical protein [Microbulbifer sp. MLAF003]WHI52001.1 hypothetical protein P3339_04030 [Microbulbifer sp. MLAF003]
MSHDSGIKITAGLKGDSPATTNCGQGNYYGALQLFSASCAGLRQHNDDACAVRLPEGAELQRHGSLAALADGVANAEAGGEAARAAINGFFLTTTVLRKPGRPNTPSHVYYIPSTAGFSVRVAAALKSSEDG